MSILLLPIRPQHPIAPPISILRRPVTSRVTRHRHPHTSHTIRRKHRQHIILRDPQPITRRRALAALQLSRIRATRDRDIPRLIQHEGTPAWDFNTLSGELITKGKNTPIERCDRTKSTYQIRQNRAMQHHMNTSGPPLTNNLRHTLLNLLLVALTQRKYARSTERKNNTLRHSTHPELSRTGKLRIPLTHLTHHRQRDLAATLFTVNTGDRNERPTLTLNSATKDIDRIVTKRSVPHQPHVSIVRHVPRKRLPRSLKPNTQTSTRNASVPRVQSAHRGRITDPLLRSKHADVLTATTTINHDPLQEFTQATPPHRPARTARKRTVGARNVACHHHATAVWVPIKSRSENRAPTRHDTPTIAGGEATVHPLPPS